MTREQFKKHKYLIEKWAEGAQIQAIRYADWEDIVDPKWNINVEYRIKPSPEYVPFDYSDAEQLIGKAIKTKDDRVVTMICYCVTGNEIITGGGVIRTYKNLFEDYTFLDGSPCGKLSNF